ncbi:MAG: MotA/TolQ/ExbB proton channel family protein [Pseudomonadales bacterium]|nr:MotA/TolQ/ExbB proton channel family protein [Pseudomonadales bacterium]
MRVKISNMRKLFTIFSLSLFSVTLGLGAVAEEAVTNANEETGLVVNKVDTLGDLLDLVKERRVVESREHSKRLTVFRADKARQAQDLKDAKAERRREEQRSDRLETTFEQNERLIEQLQGQLDTRLGSLRELFGVLQQVAGDTRGNFQTSIISVQYPNRGDWLGELAKKMGTSSQLATIDEIEQLWYELQREMTESGKVVKFDTTLNLSDGTTETREVVRVGTFGIISDGEYLHYQDDIGALTELGRQPPSRFTNTVSNLTDASSSDGLVPFSVDPTRGSLLSLLIQAATVGERVGSPMGGILSGECYMPFCDGQGGEVGSVIIMLGIFGVLLSIERMFSLSMVGKRVSAQRKSDVANSDNPLGRVLNVYEDNKDVDVETLELKLGEAVLSEMPGLTRFITIIQVISVVSPLLGLLGTVIGMINTFQAITLFGTGDPQTMAGGISTALMTTVLGLCAAIPTVLLHSIVSTKSKSIIHVLEEQSAGIVADQAEKAGKALG